MGLPVPDAKTTKIMNNDEVIQKAAALLTDIVRGLVTAPDLVKVNYKAVANLCVMQIETQQRDVPIVIGKGGKRISAMKGIIGAILGARGIEYEIGVKDEMDRDRRPQPVARNNPNQILDSRVDKQKYVKLWSDLLTRMLELLIVPNGKFSITKEELPPEFVIFKIQVDRASYPYVMGRQTEFVYGMEGLVYGSIKALGDAFGKAANQNFRFTLAEG